MNAEFLEIVELLKSVDITSTPAYKTKMALANHPERKFPVEAAFYVQLNVNEEFVNDPAFSSVIDAYINMMNQLYLKLNFPLETTNRIFLQAAKEMTLTYTY